MTKPNQPLVILSLFSLLAGVLAGLTLPESALLPAQAQGGAQKKPITKASQPKVLIYLHSGTERIGSITTFDGKSLTLKTEKGLETIPRKSYQGLVLHTPEEKAVSEQIAKDMGAYMEAGQYTFDYRNRVKATLDIAATKAVASCPKSMKGHAWAHFQILPNQTVQNLVLLAPSGCSTLDTAILKAIKATKPEQIPASLNVKLFPMNYIYDPKGFQYDAKADTRPHPGV